MVTFEFPVSEPVQYILTGKFKSPSPEWVHLKRQLLDGELILITENTLYITIGGHDYTLNKGDFLVCPPYSHQEGFKASDCSFYWLHFYTENMDKPLKAVAEPTERTPGRIMLPISGTVKSLEKLIVLMKQLQDAVRSYQDKDLNGYLTTSILCELYNQCFFYEEKDETTARRQQLYNDIVDYVKWYIRTNIKVVDIANHFGYNEKYLSHLFHSIKKMSLKQYILQEKIELAKFMLTDTNESIAIISEKLGFNDSHNFMKMFKKNIGLTPTEYRNAYDKRLLYYV